MHSDLVSALKLDSISPLNKFLLVTRDDRSDASFIYSDVLSFLIKSNFNVVLLNLAQSSTHYYHILLKNGVNLKSLRESGRLEVLDCLGSAEGLLDSSTKEEKHLLEGLTSELDSPLRLKRLYERIETSTKETMERNLNSGGFVIFIDDISILYSLGVPQKGLQVFIHYLTVHCRESNGLLFIGGQLNAHDKDFMHFITYVSHMTDMRVHVQGLSTGYSKEVHGKLSWALRHENTYDIEKGQVLFRIGEQTAKFSPYVQ